MISQTLKSSPGEDSRRILRRDPDPYLFRPITLRSVTVRNRIMLSPMCQYSAADGIMNDWHFAHLAARATGGCGIVFTEAVHTAPHARITRYCLGLWNDAQRDAMRRVVEFIMGQGATPAIQLGHAGRKSSLSRPWEGNRPLLVDEGGWQSVGASTQPYAAGWPTPVQLTMEAIQRELDGFRDAARRAREAGFQIVEIHAAHGYLLHQFLSPLSNDRDDAYGGSFENRTRLLHEAVDAVRSEWPAEFPIFVRLSCSDWVPGGWSLEDSVELCRQLKSREQVDLVDCSSGGNDPRQRIPIHPGYQVPFAAAIRAATGLATAAVGLIASADLAESILANGEADLIVLGRKLLADPTWPMHAAKVLRAGQVRWPIQYERADIF